MDRLPTEVIAHITDYLSKRERFNMSLVSKRLHHVLSNYNLYQTLEFSLFHQADFEEAINFFKKHSLGYTVQQLSIIGCNFSVDTFMQLPILFPNLKSLSIGDFISRYTKEGTKDFYRLTKSDILQETLSSWRHLRTVKELTSSFEMIKTLLRRPEPSRLTTIDIRFASREGYLKRYPEGPRELIRLTKNAPLLQTFSASYCFFSLLDLEELHQNCPNLKRLRLDMVLSETLDQSISHPETTSSYESNLRLSGINVTTAAENLVEMAITLFPLRYIEAPSAIGVLIFNWLYYIAKKYPRMSDLKVRSTVTVNLLRALLSGIEIDSDQQIAFALSNLNYVKTLDLSAIRITPKIATELMTDNRALEKLTISAFEDYPLYTQLRNLANTESVHHIRKLCLLYRNNATSMDFDRLEVFSQFHNLGHLSIAFRNGKQELSLDRILLALPKLEELSLEGALFKPTTEAEYPHALALKSLRINGYPTNSQDSWYSLKEAIRIVLASSPLLEAFEFISATTQSPFFDTNYKWNLDFAHQTHLRKLDIYLSFDNYFVLNNMECIRFVHSKQVLLRCFSMNSGTPILRVSTADTAPVQVNKHLRPVKRIFSVK